MRDRTGPRGRHIQAVGALLILVMTVLFVVAVMVLFQSMRSSSVVAEVTRAAHGTVCQLLAESVAEEVFRLLCVEANTQAPAPTAAYAAFRDEARPSFEIEYSPQHLSISRALIARAGPDYVLERARASAIVKAPITHMSYETHGLVRVEAHVTHRRVPRAGRRVELLRDFRVSLISPGRPFDQLTLMIANPEMQLPPDPNAQMRFGFEEINRARKRLEDIIELIGRGLGAAAGTDLGAAGDSASRARAKLQSVLELVTPLAVADVSRPVVGAGAAVHPHYLGDPEGTGLPPVRPAEVILYSTDPTIELASLDLVTPMRAMADRIDQVTREQVGQFDRLLADLQRQPESVTDERVDAYAESERALVLAHKERLGAYRRYEDSLGEVTGAERRSWIDRFFYKFLRSEWQEKASCVLQGGQGRPPSTQMLTHLLSRLKGTFNGVLFVDNGPSDPLVVGGRPFKGKAVVVATGPIVARHVTVEDKTRDLLVLVSYEAFTVEGTVQASLVLAGEGTGRLHLGAGVAIEGNLVVRGAVSVTPAGAGGRLTMNPRVFSGNTESDPRISHEVVSFGPPLRARLVHRED